MPGIAQSSRFHSLEIPELSLPAQQALDAGRAVVDYDGCVRPSKYFIGGHYPMVGGPGFMVETNAHAMPQHPMEHR